MDKKAQAAIQPVMKAILTIFIIIIILFITIPQLREPAMKLFGMAGNLTRTESEIAITEAEYIVTSSKIVINSINALACAINSISTNQFPNSSCAPEFNIYTASMTELKVSEIDYVQKVGDALLDCFKNYKPLKKEVRSLPCFAVNTGEKDFKIQPNKIQDYLKGLERTKDKDADALAGSWFFQAGKEYSIELTENILKKDSVICGINNKILLTDDKSKCGIIQEEKCEAGEMQYGATCLKCEKEKLQCCEYCADSYCDIKAQIWVREEQECSGITGGKITDDTKCSLMPKGVYSEHENPETFVESGYKCTIKNFVLPEEIRLNARVKENSIIVQRFTELKERPEERFDISPAKDYNIVLVEGSGSIVKGDREGAYWEFILTSPSRHNIEIKKDYCQIIKSLNTGEYEEKPGPCISLYITPADS